LILSGCPEEAPHTIGLMEGAWWIFFKWLIGSSIWLSSVPFWLHKAMFVHSALQLSAVLFWLPEALIWSVLFHTLHSVYVQWVIKWIKIGLACIVVLQDPICKAIHHQAKRHDVRFRIMFDCQFPMFFHVFDSLALRRY